MNVLPSDDGALSLLDYFAAHAPDVPEWFSDPVRAPYPPTWPVASDQGHVATDASGCVVVCVTSREWGVLRDWTDKAARHEIPSGLSDRATEWAKLWQAHAQAAAAHNAESPMRTLIAWRWHYADMMIEERSK